MYILLDFYTHFNVLFNSLSPKMESLELSDLKFYCPIDSFFDCQNEKHTKVHFHTSLTTFIYWLIDKYYRQLFKVLSIHTFSTHYSTEYNWASFITTRNHPKSTQIILTTVIMISMSPNYHLYNKSFSSKSWAKGSSTIVALGSHILEVPLREAVW